MFSVITITYNRKQLLEKAIRSVLNQSSGEFEYIIVDDGSDDGTGTMVATLNDKRITYINIAHLGWLSKLRNIGLDKATGEIITFLDSDDYWEPNYLENLSKIYSSPVIKSVVVNSFISDGQKSNKLFGAHNQFWLKKDLLKEQLLNDAFVIYPSSFSFRKNTGLRFNENLNYGENDLFLRILAMGNTIISPIAFIHIIKHDSNISSKNEVSIQNYFEEIGTLDHLKKNRAISIVTYCRAKSKFLYRQGNCFLSANKKHEARKNYLKSFIFFPFNIKSLLKSVYALLK